MQKIVRKLELAPADERGTIPAPVTPALRAPWAIRVVEPGSADVALVHRWMHENHVKMVMHKDWPLEAWQREIEEQNADTFCRPYIVSHDGVDGGYVELYRAQRDVLSLACPVERHDIGLHGAIGAVEALSQGHAFRFWLALLDGVFSADPFCQRVFSDPNADNFLVRKLDEKVCEATGGRFLGEVKLPHKLAAVFAYEREPFLESSRKARARRAAAARA